MNRNVALTADLVELVVGISGNRGELVAFSGIQRSDRGENFQTIRSGGRAGARDEGGGARAAADFFAAGGARAASDTVVTGSSAFARTDFWMFSPLSDH